MKLTTTSDSSTLNVFDTLSEIDNRLLELPEENNWFEDPEKAFYYTPHIAGSRVLRVQLPMKYNRIDGVEIVDDVNGDQCTTGDITPGTLVECELEWKNVWIIDQTFGYFWSVKKISIHQQEN